MPHMEKHADGTGNLCGYLSVSPKGDQVLIGLSVKRQDLSAENARRTSENKRKMQGIHLPSLQTILVCPIFAASLSSELC
jgi:hypothetical protein